MHALEKPRSFWIDNILPWETNFQELPFYFFHVHMQEEQQGRNGNLPPYTFGMGDAKEEKKGGNDLPTYTFDMVNVKEKRSNMIDILVDTSSTLFLLGILDPYWKSQLLVEYSKDLHTCMVLDDLLHDESYSILDGVIYNHGRIFFSRASNLKEKLLQRAYEEFCFSHTFSMKIYNIIMLSLIHI